MRQNVIHRIGLTSHALKSWVLNCTSVLTMAAAAGCDLKTTSVKDESAYVQVDGSLLLQGELEGIGIVMMVVPPAHWQYKDEVTRGVPAPSIN